jgi:hypothetical protein
VTPDATYTLPPELETYRSRALIVGVVGLAACALGFAIDREHFFRAWLIGYLLWFSVSLGSLALMMVQHLSGGAWGVFRRVFEASSGTLPLMALLFFPVILGMQTLYPWSHPEVVAADEVLRHKAPYLNPTFFVVRAALYFIGWILMTWTMVRWSRAQDAGDVAVSGRMQRLSGAGLVFYALTVTLAAVDWVMSLNPHWYSTLFGFIFIGGQGLASLAFTILVATVLRNREPMAGVLKPSHFHDLGKLSLAFVMLWAYFNFSQYLLIYAANLVEEIPYLIARITHGWQYLALFLVVFQFAVPFALLLSRDRKRAPERLALVAAGILIVRYTDLFMLVSPEFSAAGTNLHVEGGEHEGGFFVRWLDLAAPAGIGGVWLWMFFTQLGQRPMVAVADPYLREALQSGGHH